MKTKKNGFSLIELLVVITIISILAAIFIPCFMRKRSEMGIETNITTISVGQPDLGIEPAKFYLVKGEEKVITRNHTKQELVYASIILF